MSTAANTHHVPTFPTTRAKIIYLVSAGTGHHILLAREEAGAEIVAARMGKTVAANVLIRASWRCPSGTTAEATHEERCAKVAGRTFKTLKAAWTALESAGLR